MTASPSGSLARFLPRSVPRCAPRLLLGALLSAVPCVFGQALPDLGDVSQATITPLQERRLGESIMREIRTDRTYYDEPEATDYLNQIGQRLAARSEETRQEFEFFLGDPDAHRDVLKRITGI